MLKANVTVKDLKSKRNFKQIYHEPKTLLEPIVWDEKKD